MDGSVESSGAGLEDAAVRVLKPGGTAAMLSGEAGRDGLPGGRRTIGVIQGDAVPQSFIPRLIRLHLQGRFPFDRLARFYPVSKINRAVADARRGAVIKPVLTWD